MTPTHRVTHNVAPLYKLPDIDSEMVSQAIWGSAQQQIASEGDFRLVTGEDLYTGWIRAEFLTPSTDESDCAVTTIAPLFAEVYREPNPSSAILTRLTSGARIVLSRLPAFGHFVPIILSGEKIGYVHEGHLSLTYSSLPQPAELTLINTLTLTEIAAHVRTTVASTSLLFVGVPYLWGGTTPFGLDCSGYTQLVYRVNGVQLLRDSSMQWGDRRFQTIDTNKSGLNSPGIQPADLLFFYSKSLKPLTIAHVGIALGHGRFVHSAGRGRGNIVSDCDDPEFTAIFAGVRRFEATDGLSVEYA